MKIAVMHFWITFWSFVAKCYFSFATYFASLYTTFELPKVVLRVITFLMLAIWLGKSLLAGKMSVPVLKIPVLGVLVAVFIVLYILATVFRLRRFKCFWLVSAFRALQFCYV